tara:strand:+ start:561 stop:722 length:162 start_codon:yes stop_codon:yes gene_type:complete
MQQKGKFMNKTKAIKIIVEISYLLADESDYEKNISPKLAKVIEYLKNIKELKK